LRSAPFGEGAVYIDLEIEEATERAPRTLAAAAALRAALPGADVAVGAGTILVVGPASEEEAQSIVLPALSEPPSSLEEPKSHVIKAVYDGPDLASSAEALGLKPEALIELHTGRDHVAELLGFLPGFAYLGPIDDRLVLPRRPSPRPAVPAGSVAIAGSFTGIYPSRSPGGWNLIARAIGVDLFDPARDRPMLIAPGDPVRFVSIPAGEAGDIDTAGLRPNTNIGEGGGGPSGAALEITASTVLSTIQDGGRPGQLGRGIPPGGPLDPFVFFAANRAVGNNPEAAAIEIMLGALRARARRAILVSVDGAPAIKLKEGEELRVEPNESAVRYVAVRGGVDVPALIGSRSTLLAARFGGLEGRPLRRGDLLAIGPDSACGSPESPEAPPGSEVPAILEMDPGPHADRFPEGALDVLLETQWTVSRLADRVGVRLEGGKIPRDRPDLALPVPMRRGAMQIATDGTPIILGPDHPVTGGYPVLAIVRRASQAVLARLRAGAAVKLRLGQSEFAVTAPCR
jgi:KipI family sensor histidine kinase inhibitor